MGFNALSEDLTLGEDAIVVDNSVVMRWILDDGSNRDRRYARSVLDYVMQHEATVLVPVLWVYEAAFVVQYYVKQDALACMEAHNHLSALFNVLTVMQETFDPGSYFETGHAQGLSAYDSVHLKLAGVHGLPLATLDKKMKKVAEKIGVPVFVP